MSNLVYKHYNEANTFSIISYLPCMKERIGLKKTVWEKFQK